VSTSNTNYVVFLQRTLDHGLFGQCVVQALATAE